MLQKKVQKKRRGTFIVLKLPLPGRYGSINLIVLD